MTRIFYGPEELADYHQQIMGEVPADMHLIAKDDDCEACLYISDKNGMPVITATLHGIEVESRDYFEDSEDLENVAVKMFAVYVGLPSESNFQNVDIDDEYTDDDLRALYGKDDPNEDEVEDNEEEFSLLLDQVLEFLIGTEELCQFENYSHTDYKDVIDGLKDSICDTLTDLGFDVRRPTLVQLDDGSTDIVYYPYGADYTESTSEE